MKQYLITDFLKRLDSLDGKIFSKYKALTGSYASREWTLFIDKVQSSPKSSPSCLRIRVPNMHSGFPPSFLKSPARKVAASDFMTRKFRELLKKISHGTGSGKSGRFYIEPCGNEILARSTIIFGDHFVEGRFRYGFPADGNRISGEEFRKTMEITFPRIVKEILSFESYSEKALESFIHCYEDQEFLRAKLKEKGLLAFIPNGALLPRESAVSDAPLPQALPFSSPESLKVTMELPHKGTLRGMGIPRGITVITGGGFHGKTTLLNAIKMGIYNHIPGDGREYCVSDRGTFKLNAEDGRYASGIDISAYIVNLPFERDSKQFSSQQCSGSTSQAAGTMEAIRMGATSLLLDEDTSATNFLVCDPLMDRLIGAKDKTILPFLDSARSLYKKHSVSSVIVAGSLSPCLKPADLVIKMSGYAPFDMTEEVRRQISPAGDGGEFDSKALQAARIVDSGAFRIRKRQNPFKAKVISRHEIQVDRFIIDLKDNEQLVDPGQVRTLLACLFLFEELVFQRKLSLEKAIFQLFEDKEKQGLDRISEGREGFTEVRPIDFAFALNRFRMLKILGMK